MTGTVIGVGKPIEVYDIDMRLLARFDTAVQAAAALGVSPATISKHAASRGAFRGMVIAYAHANDVHATKRAAAAAAAAVATAAAEQRRKNAAASQHAVVHALGAKPRPAWMSR